MNGGFLYGQRKTPYPGRTGRMDTEKARPAPEHGFGPRRTARCRRSCRDRPAPPPAPEMLEFFGGMMGRARPTVSCAADPEVLLVGGCVSGAGEMPPDAIRRYGCSYAFFFNGAAKTASRMACCFCCDDWFPAGCCLISLSGIRIWGRRRFHSGRFRTAGSGRSDSLL